VNESFCCGKIQVGSVSGGLNIQEGKIMFFWGALKSVIIIITLSLIARELLKWLVLAIIDYGARISM